MRSMGQWTGSGLLVAALVIVGSVDARAQISAEFAAGNLAPAAQEMAAAGVDGSASSLATMIEIAQRHGFGYGISPDEVRAMFNSGYLAVRQVDCSSLTLNAANAQRLSRVLSSLAWLYAAGAGLTISMPPVAAALGFGALVTGMAATVASWVAADYRERRAQVKCTKGGTLEWFRHTTPQVVAALDPAISRFSSPHSCGA